MSEQTGADMMLWLFQICQDFTIYKVSNAWFDYEATWVCRLGRYNSLSTSIKQRSLTFITFMENLLSGCHWKKILQYLLNPLDNWQLFDTVIIVQLCNLSAQKAQNQG